ncbi:hypothetical protein J6590_089069 [Homalodisca vitripennis]|nr:hypothetical protein J6590_089069 [Homalodisca vitripennis]
MRQCITEQAHFKGMFAQAGSNKQYSPLRGISMFLHVCCSRFDLAPQSSYRKLAYQHYQQDQDITPKAGKQQNNLAAQPISGLMRVRARVFRPRPKRHSLLHSGIGLADCPRQHCDVTRDVDTNKPTCPYTTLNSIVLLCLSQHF